MAELPRLRVGLTLDSDTFIRETNKVIDSVNKMSRQIERQNTIAARSFNTLTTATNLLRTSLTGLVGGLSLGALTRFGREALDAAGNLGELATAAGVSVKELQQLQVAGLQVGISQEELVRSLGQFAIRAGEAAKNAGPLKDTLIQYGIRLKDTEGRLRSSTALLFDLADAVKNARSEQERHTIVADAFGARIGNKLLPALIKGAAGLREFMSVADRVGLVLGDEFVKKADRASDALNTLQFAFGKGFQVGFVEAFADSVGDSEDAIRQVTEAGKEAGKIVGEVFEGLASAASALMPFLKQIGSEFETIRDIADEVKNVLAAVGLRDLSLDDANRQLGEIKDRLAELAVLRETLSRAAQEAGKAPESTEAIHQLNLEEDALRRRREVLLAAQSAALSAAGANKALEVSIHDTVPPTNQATKATVDFMQIIKDSIKFIDEMKRATKAANEEQKRWDASKIASENERLSSIAEDFVKRANQQRAAAAESSEKLSTSLHDELSLQRLLLAGVSKESEEYRIHVALLGAKKQTGGEITAEQARLIRLLERNATVIDKQAEGAEDIKRAFQSAADGIQEAFADTFTTIFEGGVTSAQDFAVTLRHIFAQLAGQIAALMLIRPVLAGGVLGGAAGGIGGAGASLASQLGFGTFPLTGTANPAAGGVRTGPGGLLVGGGVTSSLGAPVRPVPGFLGAPSGATAGGLIVAGGLGALGGAQIGGLFGGQGNIGGAVGGGLGATLGTAFLGPLGGLAGGVGGSLFGGILGSLFGGGTSGHKVGIGGGLGAITGTGEAAKFAADLDRQLLELLDTRSKRLVDEALKRAPSVKLEFGEEGLSENDIKNLAHARLRPAVQTLGFNVSGVLGGTRTAEEGIARLQEAIEAKKAIDDLQSGLGDFAKQARTAKDAFDELNQQAAKFGISAQARARAANAFIEEGREDIRARLRQLAGAPADLTSQLAQLGKDFGDVRQAAQIYGYSLASVAKWQAAATAELKKQFAAQRETAAAQVKALLGNRFANEIASVNKQFADGYELARQFGIATTGLASAQREAIAALKKRQQAEVDAIALGVVDPFKQLRDPLQSFLTTLKFADLNPLKQLEAARKDFERIANLARAGSTVAIGQLQGAGELFERLAEQVGASPGGVSARAEVANVIESVLRDLDRAQKEAQRGIETEVKKASDREIDTLRELIAVGRETVTELKKLRRS